jgi:hypothetical protein
MIPGDGLACQSALGCDRSIPALARVEQPRPVRALKEGANGVAGHTSSSFVACRTGAGSTSKRRHGGIVEDGLPAGPTLWRQLGCGGCASRSAALTSRKRAVSLRTSRRSAHLVERALEGANHIVKLASHLRFGKRKREHEAQAKREKHRHHLRPAGRQFRSSK